MPCVQVWTPEQCARAMVESGLHYVDALAIANCVAQQMFFSVDNLDSTAKRNGS